MFFPTLFSHIGKISLFKVNSGRLRKDTEVLNPNKNKKERIAQIIYLRGNKQEETQELIAGDIGATTKLQYTQTGDTLCDKEKPIMYRSIELPEPCLYSSVEPAQKADDEKLSTCLQRMMEEDPTFVINRNYETKQLLIGGQGEKHLYVILCKIKINLEFMLFLQIQLFLIVKLLKELFQFKENIKNNLVEQDNMEMFKLNLNLVKKNLNL